MEPQKITDVQYSYDRVADEYVQRIVDELQHKPLDRQLLEHFAVRVHGLGPVCDLGCGPGHVARYLYDRRVPVQGIDLSPAMIAYAQQLHPGIDFTHGNMLALDVGDAVWGGMVAFYSLIHIPRADLNTVLRELKRVLRPRGVLLLAFSTAGTTPSIWTSGRGTQSRWTPTASGPRKCRGMCTRRGLPWRRSLNAPRIRRWNTPVIGCTCLPGSRRSSVSLQAVAGCGCAVKSKAPCP
jgi:ubiquinone/menaquinone biosynthesis C-methylase UbiE